MTTQLNTDGIQYPIDERAKKASTSKVAKQVLHAALQPISSVIAKKVIQEKNWRKNYPYYFKHLLEGQIQSTTTALQSAEAGLKQAQQSMLFQRHSKSLTVSEAMKQYQNQHIFETYQMTGKGEQTIAPWGIPYQGEFLTGQKLLDQLAIWEKKGIIEPSNAHALRTVNAHPEWFDLSSRTMVLFGAASEAGPLTWLSKWKANIIAIDLPNEKVWQKIRNIIEQGNATLIAPQQITDNGQTNLGADLLKQTPEIANWLANFEQQLDLAGIAYLNGEKHVRVSLAMIAIMQKVSRLKSDSSLMFMLTPTDIYAVPKHVFTETEIRRENRGRIEKILSKAVAKVTFSSFFKANDKTLFKSNHSAEYGISDCMVIEQGPNYALAKRLQQWYAMLARQNGQKVSINIAPSTTTQSVIKNPLLKAAFAGADLFGVEAFAPETTNAIMAAIWIYDLHCEQSLSNPDNVLEHPLKLIMENANHGGLWNVPYLVRTALPFSALYGFGIDKLKQLKK